MNLRNSLAVASRLKKNCPKFDANKIHITKLGSEFTVILAGPDKLIKVNFYDYSEALEMLYPKFNQYFEGRGWDTNVYYRIYGTDPKDDKKNVFLTPTIVARDETSASNGLGHIRATFPTDCGLMDVAQDLKAVTVDQIQELTPMESVEV